MVFVVGTYFGTCVVALATASVTSPFYQQYAGPMIQNLLAQCAATCNTPLLLVFRLYFNSFRIYLFYIILATLLSKIV
jgi:hypothetical protein